MAYYPNQKTFIIKKAKKLNDYLSVENDDWHEAYKRYVPSQPSAFGMYLYLAENAPEFSKHLSPKDVEKELGISESSYRRALKTLENDGYVVHQNKNIWYFYTKPHTPVIDDTLSQVTDNVSTGDTSTPVIDEYIPLSQVDTHNTSKKSKNTSKTKEAKASKGADAPTPDGAEERLEILKSEYYQDEDGAWLTKHEPKEFSEMTDEEKLAFKLVFRGTSNPNVAKATKIFNSFANKELWALEDGLKNKTISYNDLKYKYKLPNDCCNSSIYDLVKTEKHHRQNDGFSLDILKNNWEANNEE